MSRSKAAVKRGQTDDDFRRTLVQEIGLTVRWALVAATALGVAYLFVQAIESLAGKQTDASILVNMLGAVEISVGLSWVVGVGGVVYGRAQKKLRQRTVSRLHGRIEELELKLDPNRQSSKLTRVGETNPEDDD